MRLLSSGLRRRKLIGFQFGTALPHMKETTLAKAKSKASARKAKKKVASARKVRPQPKRPALRKRNVPRAKSSGSLKASARPRSEWAGPLPDKPMPRATKLPPEGELLTKREMEQVLTAGSRGVAGEGGLKGVLVVHENFPYLEVIGRDKRELYFLLQGPDQEVLPAYADHKVSVSGLIKRFHANGGSVDVRKYTARKSDETSDAGESDATNEPAKLRLLAPGEIETLCNPGMSVGVRGVASLRGRLEHSGDEYFLVVSNVGTRQQVSFTLVGKGARHLKKYIGETAVATGIVEKQTGWGGQIEVEACEPRAPEFPPISRVGMNITELEVSAGTSSPKTVNVRLNNGVVLKFAEKLGHVWTIEPQMGKKVSLREVNLHAGPHGSVREFFFTPRNPGRHEVVFFLAKIHNPMRVARTFTVIIESSELSPRSA